MEKLIEAFSSKSKEKIIRLCKRYEKEYTEMDNKKILIKGEALEAILDEIRMNQFGKIISINKV